MLGGKKAGSLKVFYIMFWDRKKKEKNKIKSLSSFCSERLTNFSKCSLQKMINVLIRLTGFVCSQSPCTSCLWVHTMLSCQNVRP